MSVDPADYKLPFCVEFGNDINASVCGNEKRFATYGEAIKFAESQAEKFCGVWLYEIGTYTTRQGRQRTDWIYFWWSKAVTDSDEPWIGRSTGRPLDYPNQWVSYQPI